MNGLGAVVFRVISGYDMTLAWFNRAILGSTKDSQKIILEKII